MGYRFSVEKFKENFNAKDITDKSIDSVRITHRPDGNFQVFPYKATGKAQAPIVTELETVVSGFFREVLKKKTEPIEYNTLCAKLLEELEIEEEDTDYFKDMIRSLFFSKDGFVAYNLGLYPYQTLANNKSVESLAHFLFSILDMNDDDCKKIEDVKNTYKYNVLEELVIKNIESNKALEGGNRKEYFIIKNDIQERFKNDFYFMLESGMTSQEDLANLLAVYYFYYVSQTCIILDQFCTGKRTGEEKLYYAVDWEKVSKNRKCCEEGWNRLQDSINHMFSHAITLKILNQTEDEEKVDYISLSQLAGSAPYFDEEIAAEVEKAEATYCSYVGDFKGFSDISYKEGSSKTETAIRHLFDCVELQFLHTERQRANQAYSEKFSGFCKERWVKNRKKSRLVLNLTERDIIFLTKICLRNEEKIRLNKLFKEYELRGICLDNTSREYLQEFFTKLNLIDRKSDSGDAQYVKRIL